MKITFSKVMHLGGGDKEVLVYVNGSDIGELYYYPGEGMDEWGCSASVESAVQEDCYGATLREMKKAILDAAKQNGIAKDYQ